MGTPMGIQNKREVSAEKFKGMDIIIITFSYALWIRKQGK